MTYAATWINRIDTVPPQTDLVVNNEVGVSLGEVGDSGPAPAPELKRVDLDLILEDDDGVMPPRRIPLSFDVPVDADEAFLDGATADAIARATDEWANRDAAELARRREVCLVALVEFRVALSSVADVAPDAVATLTADLAGTADLTIWDELDQIERRL